MNSIRPRYVVDTNALIWYLIRDKRLTPAAFRIFEAAEHGETRLIISAIVIVELFYANQKKPLFEDFDAIYRDIKSKSYFRLVPLAADAVRDFDKISAIPEMHDRIIVGLARRLNAPILTSDRIITASGLVNIVW